MFFRKFETTTVVAMNLQTFRASFGISQSKLARMSGVSRFKLCTFELGNGRLDESEQERVRKAFQSEANRVHCLVATLDPKELSFDIGSAPKPLSEEAQR